MYGHRRYGRRQDSTESDLIFGHVDDFTLEHGAIYLLPESHLNAEKPDPDTFYKQTVRVIGKAGSIVLFNSNMWHAGGASIQLTMQDGRLPLRSPSLFLSNSLAIDVL